MTRHSLLILVLPALLLTTAFGCKAKQPATNDNTNTAVNTSVTNTTTVVTNTATITNTIQPNLPPTEAELQRLASSFTERYGSYSNQTNYANLENVLVFMTPKFQQLTAAYIAQQRSKNADTGVYYGITTRSTSVVTNHYASSDDTSQFAVSTLRREAIGSTANTRTFQQTLLIDMQRQQGVWKIDQATWQ